MPAALRKRGGQVAPIRDRLERLSMPLAECGCRIWLGELDEAGYGLMRIEGKIHRAHRVSWAATHGPIPDGVKVLHRCDIRCCIEENHLFPGTQAENIADMWAKGRAADRRGERNSNARITATQADEIRASSLSTTRLGAQYGISASMVSNIKRGLNWND